MMLTGELSPGNVKQLMAEMMYVMINNPVERARFKLIIKG